MPSLKSIIFVDCGDDGLKALSVSAGQILKLSDIPTTPQMSKTVLKEAIGAMTIKDIETMAGSLGFRISNIRKTGKESLVDFVVNEWYHIQTRATNRAKRADSLSSPPPRDTPDPSMEGKDDKIAPQAGQVKTKVEKETEMKERFKESVRAIEKNTYAMEISRDGKLKEARKLGEGSRLDEDGWNSDKEKALFFLEKLNEDDFGFDTDRLMALRKEKAQQSQSSTDGQPSVLDGGYKSDAPAILGTARVRVVREDGVETFTFDYTMDTCANVIFDFFKDLGLEDGFTLKFETADGSSQLFPYDCLNTYFCDNKNATITLTPTLAGGAKPVIKVEKLAISKSKCTTLAQKVPPSTQSGLVKYDQTYRTLTETPDAISKMIAQMPLDDVNAVLKMYEEGGIKEQTMNRLAKLVVADIKEVEEKKDQFSNLYTALVQAFHYAMLNGYYNETKGKVIFEKFKDEVKTRRDVEETKAQLASAVPMST